MDEAERLCDRVAIMDHGKVIALGTPRELIASIGVEHMVEFSAGAIKLSTFRLCARMDGVRDVHVRERQRADAGDGTASRGARRCSTNLRARASRSPNCAPIRPTLEDVFVALTGRHLRDE